MPRQKRKYKDLQPALDADSADDGAGGFFAIRDIIDEDKTRYKIDWEDNATTGKKYSPSWVRVFMFRANVSLSKPWFHPPMQHLYRKTHFDKDG